MKIGVVMDAIESIAPHKDTSFALMLEAQRRGHTCFYIRPESIGWEDNTIFAQYQPIKVKDSNNAYYALDALTTTPVADLDCILMRKDPPFDMRYIYLTYLLEHAEKSGVRVINHPRSLRDANEKCFITHFPDCCPKTLITSQISHLLDFLDTHQHIVVKPLDSMGGQSIFEIQKDSKNKNVILETLTQNESLPMMAQAFLDVHRYGDKRVFLVHGTPAPYALKRTPSTEDFRGNLASGAASDVVVLSERDHWICKQIGPTLIEKGLHFVGIDIIGDFLTEINVTSPTGVREIERDSGFSISQQFFDWLESEIKT